jgi:hypothetical protein
MDASVQSPDPYRLLPPLLACLPTSFASPRPPPALLPLVSPVLRQRLQFLSTPSTTTSDTWLRLLCWSKEKAAALQEIVADGAYEPHPSSGEIEVGAIKPNYYQRTDQDTLHARIELLEWRLTALYQWCDEGEAGRGWKLAELLPSDDNSQKFPGWSESIAEADQVSRDRQILAASRQAEDADLVTRDPADEAYWAQYDSSSEQSPLQARFPATGGGGCTGERSEPSEADYYALYADVQPALDNKVPHTVPDDTNTSSVDGELLANTLTKYISRAGVVNSDPTKSQTPSLKTEERAATQPAFEAGIQQHVITTIENLYRLADDTGIKQEVVTRIIRAQLVDED